MAMAKLVVLLVALAAAVGSCSAWELNIRMPTARDVEAAAERLEEDVAAPLIHALRPVLGSGGQLWRRAGVPCDSWRLAVEAYNKRDWRMVPAYCERYVGHYMLGGHYRRDSRVVVDEAIAYAEGLKLAGNGKEVWVFDIDETSLSNLPYYATHGFGTRPYNATSFNEYVLEGSAPALPETQRLFYKLIALGIKPVFLTGRTENQRAITVKNLRRQGYASWDKLLLKPIGFKATAIAYKSGERQKLQNAGFIIVGNIGDQWSDILGAPEGARTFKLPDPLYYIG
ncbi:stem 28 kDa glycoprotein-like [Phragmites australis]|uniref:stem 28 kDa glycoprotein-like n=1 Tax=Phragmites australis TaxID=29695 RepID=UPI002D767DAE|nr:stem 28 kDa glycoprotein-like [Phragmites australis]